MIQATANRTRKTHIGLALIALGSVMIFANLTVVANFLSGIDAQTIGTPAAATLAFLDFARNLVFNPSALLPFAGGILILFLAFAGVFSGLLLLRDRTRARTVENA
jgi:membrane-bound ClpP family serine protease